MYEAEPPTFWAEARETRKPWAPDCVLSAIRDWLFEAEHAKELSSAGEKVMPLLLAGPTRCGKTSVACGIARHFGLPAQRMAIGSVIGQFMGQTTKAMKNALDEAYRSQLGVWIIDELDGLFQQRTGGHGPEQEMTSAISVALATIEAMPAHVLLVGTTNEIELIDRAMVARFCLVEWPPWERLCEADKRQFAKSHGCEEACDARSYSGAVQWARRARVRKIVQQVAER
jgi:hypothetical protein